MALTIALVTILLAARPPRAAASDQVVSDLGDSGGANQLRAKISACLNSGGGTITFSTAGTITLTAGPLPVIANPSPDGNINLTIDGGSEIILSGLGTASTQSRILTINANAIVTVKNITLTKANFAFDDGGAISNRGSLTVQNCHFIDNRVTSAFSGGAILTYGPLTIADTEFASNQGGGGGAVYPRFGAGVTTITRCNFHDNQAINTSGGGLGGALLVWDGPTVTITDSSFANNQAITGGGAIYVLAHSTVTINTTSLTANSCSGGGSEGGAINNQGTLNLTNVAVSENAIKAFGAGGGIRNSGNATLVDVTVSGNHVDRGGTGGGIHNSQTCTLTNVTVSGNLVPDNYPQWGGIGGGIYSSFGPLNLTNVTMSGNFAGHSPGSSAGGMFISSNTNATLKNTIIQRGADGANCVGTVSGSGNLSDDFSCGFGAGRDGVTNLNLGPLAYNGGFTQTHLPGPGSVAIDNGVTANAPELDQRSFFRIDNVADVGAVEANAIQLRVFNVMRYNKDLAITFQGVAGYVFRLERRSEIPASDWQPLEDVIPGSTTLVQVTDLGALDMTRQFYRIRLVPK